MLEARFQARIGHCSVTSQLINQMYECAFLPELWPGVLDSLAEIAGASEGWLYATNGKPIGWAFSSERGRRVGWPLMATGYIQRQDRWARYTRASMTEFMTDLDVYTREELDRDPVYRFLMRPAGFGWSAGTLVVLPTGEEIALCLEREYNHGPVERTAIDQLNELRPHFARTALMSARMHLERARAASDTLAVIGLPALIIGSDAKVLAANHLIEAKTDLIHWRARDRLTLKDQSADQLFRTALAALEQDASPGTCSFPVRDEETAFVAHILPIRRSARDIFIRCVAMLVFTPVTRPEAPPVELVRSLFDLTPVEARVAHCLAAGRTVDDIASEGGTSLNTVRTHVRGVLTKTGCNRQTDVVALLNGIWSPRVPGQI